MAGNRSEVLGTDEVLRRHSGGPRTGVFTDGSCDPNPGPGGWGFVWVEEGEIVAEQSGDEPDTTNNRMELTALIKAYETLPADGLFTVFSDSQLCVNTINQWAVGWEKRGWKRKTGPIKNLDLVKRLYTLSNEKTGITLKWIKAHDGSRWNEYADALASSYMRR
jgi:ribonuclease HI